MTCLHYFSLSEKLQSHTMDCERMNDCHPVPSEDDKSNLRATCNKERLPFIVYADLECVVAKELEKEDASYIYQQHEVFSVGYYNT
ncbi:hypothetical protein P5V15_002703 [Pogonomyrmex californicus]